MEGIKIREARREDCQAIRGLIQELADFEKMPDGPKIDHRDFREIISSPELLLVVGHVEKIYEFPSKRLNEFLNYPSRRRTRPGINTYVLQPELADSSGKSEDVKLGTAILEQDGFNSEQPFFNCYVAVAEDNIIGYALYYYTYSTWTGKAMYLEDLYVTPDFRKKHVGSMMFKTVAKKAADSGCNRLDFMVLNWNPAQDFYKSKGAVDLTKQEGWHHYRLEDAALKDLATTL